MSTSNVERFIVEANQNPEIQNDLLQRAEIGTPALIEVANKHGFKFTAEDVQTFASASAAPGSATAPTFRFTNIRANATSLIGSILPSSTFTTTSIQTQG